MSRAYRPGTLCPGLKSLLHWPKVLHLPGDLQCMCMVARRLDAGLEFQRFWLSFVFGNPPLVASCAKSLPVEAFGKVWPLSWRFSTSPSKGSPGLACSAVSIKYYAILYYVLYYGGGTELMLTIGAGCWLRAWSCTSCMSRRFIRAPLCECLQS